MVLEKHMNTLIVQYCGFKAPWNYMLISTLYHDGTTAVHGTITGLHFVDARIVSSQLQAWPPPNGSHVEMPEKDDDQLGIRKRRKRRNTFQFSKIKSEEENTLLSLPQKTLPSIGGDHAQIQTPPRYCCSMDKIENAKSEAEEVKVSMLENSNGAGEHKDVNQKAEKPQSTRKKWKEPAAKPKGNQKMEYLRANKGLVATVLISAVIILTVVVAMLVTKEADGHGHSKVHNATEIP